MTSAPSTEPDQDIEVDEDDEPSWTDFILPLALLAIAAIPFTPLWAELADPETARRKYRGVARLLDTVGPVPFTLVFAGIGIAILVFVIGQHRKSRSTAPEA